MRLPESGILLAFNGISTFAVEFPIERYDSIQKILASPNSEYAGDDDGTFKNNDELSKIYDLPKDSEIITYCQGAYRAANTFLALKKLGYEKVRVYLGSWGEWGNRPDLPIEK